MLEQRGRLQLALECRCHSNPLCSSGWESECLRGGYDNGVLSPEYPAPHSISCSILGRLSPPQTQPPESPAHRPSSSRKSSGMIEWGRGRPWV